MIWMAELIDTITFTTASSPLGTGWSHITNSWSASGGIAVADTASAINHSHYTGMSMDSYAYTVIGEYPNTSGSDMGHIAGAMDGTNSECYFLSQETLDSATGYKLRKWVSGTETDIDSHHSYQPPSTLMGHLQLSTNAQSAWLGGRKMTGTDTAVSGNYIGLHCWESQGQIDNLRAVMTTQIERMIPTGIVQQSGYTPSVTAADVDEDPNGTISPWTTATADNTDTDLVVSFNTPTGNLKTGAGWQMFIFRVRMSNTTGNNPTFDCALWENGSVVTALETAFTIWDETDARIFGVPWDASDLANVNGSNVEFRIYGNAQGGPPASRCTVEVGAIEWVAVIDPDVATGTNLLSLLGVG